MLISFALADEQQVPLLLLGEGRAGQTQVRNDQDQDVPRPSHGISRSRRAIGSAQGYLVFGLSIS